MATTLHGNHPNDLSTAERLERMIRVNHAGEYGAKRIYAGQLAVLKGTESEATIQHMAEQEQVHLDYFEQEIVKRKVRPTALHPLWHVGGFALGAATALMGEKAAMACTVAVEETIDEHYKEQLDALDGVTEEKELRDAIAKFREEELEHRDTGLEHRAEDAPGYPVLYSAVRNISKLAIKLAERV